eukprot:CAMPEP_0170177124 /NCGR_PEP_ID=MMETSP0040_2-20121228/9839_1 /TAXON_ID=641309 /ORGANISM="Lotharella oceanica, Strain CCMP622" /LENGTH=367 /DNA_ID=CAMNT_0010419657 /DNA_START=1101 /DNA_END=2204 /DNA_ORIENTATION=+
MTRNHSPFSALMRLSSRELLMTPPLKHANSEPKLRHFAIPYDILKVVGARERKSSDAGARVFTGRLAGVPKTMEMGEGALKYTYVFNRELPGLAWSLVTTFLSESSKSNPQYTYEVCDSRPRATIYFTAEAPADSRTMKDAKRNANEPELKFNVEVFSRGPDITKRKDKRSLIIFDRAYGNERHFKEVFSAMVAWIQKHGEHNASSDDEKDDKIDDDAKEELEATSTSILNVPPKTTMDAYAVDGSGESTLDGSSLMGSMDTSIPIATTLLASLGSSTTQQTTTLTVDLMCAVKTRLLDPSNLTTESARGTSEAKTESMHPTQHAETTKGVGSNNRTTLLKQSKDTRNNSPPPRQITCCIGTCDSQD